MSTLSTSTSTRTTTTTSPQAPRPTKWVVLDDTSPEISYQGPSDSWFPATDVTSTFTRNDSAGLLNSNGHVFNKTQHGSRLASSFSVTYSGAAFEAIGTIQYGDRDASRDLQWHCFVDGREVQNHENITAFTNVPSDNNWFLCGDWKDGGSGQGQHTVVANISATKDLPFWFDWLAYTPALDASLENKMVRLELDEPTILAGLSSGWDTGLDQTIIKGSSFKYDFIGTSFAWYGMARIDKFDPPTSNLQIGTFSVDNGPQQPINFPIVAYRGHWFNEKFFETGPLPMAKHNIAIVYTDSGLHPLGLSYVLVQNGSLSDLSTHPSSSHSSKTTTIILASVVPSVALIVVMFLGWWLYRRPQRHREEGVGTFMGRATVDPIQELRPTPLEYSSSYTTSPMVSSEHISKSSRSRQITTHSPEQPDGISFSDVTSTGEGSVLLIRRPTYATDMPPIYQE